MARAACDLHPSETASDAECELQDRRNHDDTLGLVEQILRQPIGDVHYFLEHLAAGFQPFLLPALIGCESGACQKDGHDKNTDFSHDTAPRYSARFLLDCFAEVSQFGRWPCLGM